MDDMTLLREYAANNSETAFEELVSRRVNFVYSAALRQVRDPHLAGEITQAVFIILAQKAGRISGKTILTGWFFRTTRFAALAQMRAEAKRSLRMATIEKEIQMQSEFQSPAADEIWNQMSPLLDEALATLGEKDRQAVLLRFFENRSLAEVGKNLGTGEDTARKRVSRALEKLHRYFAKRGVTSTTATIAEKISANSIQAAPVALAKSVTAVAFAKGAAATSSTLAVAKGAMKMFAWAKAKMFAQVGTGLLLVATTATLLEIPPASTDKDMTFEMKPFQAYGFCCYTNYDPSGKLHHVINSTFTAAVNGRKVYIRLDYDRDYYEEWSFDGTNSYALLDSPDRVNPVPVLRAAVTLNEIEFPVTAVEFARTIWLGLCSANYLGNSSNQPVLVPWGDWGLEGMLSYEWKMQRFAGSPFLPETIIFVASTNLWEKEKQIKLGMKGKQFPYREGFVGGKFEAVRSQTWDGMTIPVQFAVERYRFDNGAPTGNKMLQYCSVEVTNFTSTVV